MTLSLKWSGVLISKAQKVIDLRRDESRFLHTVTWAHEGMYEINADKKYIVILTTHTCSCWVLYVSGLLCSHEIAAIDHKHKDLTKFCVVYFTFQMYGRAYSLPFNPMSDVLELPKIAYTTVMLPAARRTAGPPKKRRRQTKYEKIKLLKCSRCMVVGHNQKTCKSSI
ncbi:hypothetical protein AMTR_s00015p00249640 [Amborella trichopoda]|uniref:SWIM-type domain-containing protein n=1 Tax=Amborella trichopoda TaxID=13333 RepID=W1PLK7_AMBTC|nr:hypothetical protein AMTR_s00015p00249640 [Amborella trichopoda]